jgi:hypothetical protein
VNILSANIYTDGLSAPVALGPPMHYGGSFILNAVQAIQQQDNATESPHDELRQYPKSGAEFMTDIIG